MADPESGSVALDNGKHELFATHVASGLTAQRSYQLAWSPTNPDAIKTTSAKSNGHRIMAKPGVAERVTYLRREALTAHDTDAEISRGAILDLMAEVTDALMEAADAAHAAGAPARQCQALRRLVGVHAGRVQRLTPQRTPRPDTSSDLDISGPLVRLPRCTCSPT